MKKGVFAKQKLRKGLSSIAYLQVNIAPAEAMIDAMDARAIMIEVFFIMI